MLYEWSLIKEGVSVSPASVHVMCCTAQSFSCDIQCTVYMTQVHAQCMSTVFPLIEASS